MRPKTFPAAPYVGNTRQRLQEIKEGLKQPAKLVSQALHGGTRGEGGRGGGDSKGKDGGSRQQQQHLRPPEKFNNYQSALREIRKSLMPFANDSGSASGSAHASGDVNRQMLQELVNAGCDQHQTPGGQESWEGTFPVGSYVRDAPLAFLPRNMKTSHPL